MSLVRIVGKKTKFASFQKNSSNNSIVNFHISKGLEAWFCKKKIFFLERDPNKIR